MDKHAKWIGFITDKDPAANQQKANFGSPASYLLRQFEVMQDVASASLKITALGVYKSYINGLETDDEILNPLWSDYNKHIEYQVFDVTSLVKKGKNAIGVILGDGWYTGNVAIYGRKLYGGYPLELYLELTITFADGSTHRIVSDEDFKASEGAIRVNDILNGEIVDNRLSLNNFSLPEYDCSAWQDVVVLEDKSDRLTPRISEGIKYNITLIPEFLHQTEQGCFIFDMKQNMVGNVSAKLKGEEGAMVKFRYGEMLNLDGTLYTENLRGALATDVFYCKGERIETFLPLFTFHGFRYLEITIEGKCEVFDIKGNVCYSALDETGDFNCSDEVVTQIFKNALWGQRGNFVGLPTDCPQRDERMGWTGDIQVFGMSAMYNMDCRKFLKKYFRDMVDAVREDGAITDVVPYVPVVGWGSAGWGDAVTVLPYNYYLMYGDRQVLKDMLPHMKNWLKYLHSTCGGGYLRPAGGYGDWLSVGEQTDTRVMNTAFFAQSARLTAKVCDILGEDSAAFHELYGNIKKAFRAEFVDKNNIITSDTQSCYLMALNFELMTAEDIKDNLIKTIERRDCHLTTGFIGIKYLLPTLCELGREDIAYKLITNTTYPSWGYSVVNGATTIWERWNSYTIEGGFGDVSMNSFNHYSLGSCVEWMYGYMLGIRADIENPGFGAVTVKPAVDFSGKITDAGGSYKSIRGKIDSHWKVSEGVCTFELFAGKEIIVRPDFSAYQVLSQTLDGGALKVTFKQRETV